MGSGGSKAAAAAGDGDGAGLAEGDGCSARSVRDRRRRLSRSSVLASAYFCCPSSSSSSALDCEQNRKGVRTLRSSTFMDEPVPKTGRSREDHCLRFRGLTPQTDQADCSSLPSALDGCSKVQEHTSCGYSDDGSLASTPVTAIARIPNSSLNCCSLGFISDGTGSIFDRTVFPVASAIKNPEADNHVNQGPGGPSSSSNRTSKDNVPADASMSSLGIRGNSEDTGAGDIDIFCRNLLKAGNFERRPSRWHRSQVPLEGSIKFSRALSVGRLRDRVLHVPPCSDRMFGSAVIGDRPVDDTGRRAPCQPMEGLISSGASVLSTSGLIQQSGMSGLGESGQVFESASHLMEATHREIVEGGSSFRERRRIRSQVRALQQLGNGVQTFPGHDTSCVLSGQHRTGHCPCMRNNGSANSGNGRNARSSFSRIVMLAEALFEAVVLASRPSVSSIGYVPAPRDAVERMLLRIYTRPQKHHNEETTQCYICLLEYEEGDYVRILPCHHEFHQSCVDKWLKEVHRVCPLCRGDVCTSGLPFVS